MTLQTTHASILTPLAPLVLVTDDDAVMRLVLCEAMHQEGYRTIEAENGFACLESCRRFRPDLILLDAVMPEMDGFTCCQKLRSLTPNLPILMVTSLQTSEAVDQVFAVGATDYISKPIHWAVLRQRVRRLLQAHQATTELQHRNQQVQQLTTQLESQIQERTTQLEQALKFESTLKRITDKVRDSLDEKQILHSAVQKLARSTGVQACDTALYDLNQKTSTIYFEYVSSDLTAAQGKVAHFDRLPCVYEAMLAGRSAQFCLIAPYPTMIRTIAYRFAILACPLMDDQGVLGDMWLFKPCDETFNDLEIRLVQQVANQCAIALRQSRLYQASQQQVKALEKLHHLKDEFLSTVSHELRSPIANMLMAIQMLECVLTQVKLPDHQIELFDKSTTYLKILRSECNREVHLINDLLDLQRLESGQQRLTWELIDLREWIPTIVEPYRIRAQHRQQGLQFHFADLPPLYADPISLGRVLSELLNNACKYTPPGGTIALSIHLTEATKINAAIESTKPFSLQVLQLNVSNSGSEIAAVELPRIFDQFYRVPCSDRWQQGGTGLGLALVKQLVQHLKGHIWVESAQQKTCFTIEIPLDSRH
ncbi:response regulator [Phormidesmis sp. 146-12]